jgi:hypothetical protein
MGRLALTLLFSIAPRAFALGHGFTCASKINFAEEVAIYATDQTIQSAAFYNLSYGESPSSSPQRVHFQHFGEDGVEIRLESGLTIYIPYTVLRGHRGGILVGGRDLYTCS